MFIYSARRVSKQKELNFNSQSLRCHESVLNLIMGKTARIIVCGMKGVGKTAILEQAIYANFNKGSFLQATIEDIYVANVDSERGTKEKLRLYDTAGLDNITQARHMSQTWQADGYIMVYDTSRPESFDLVVQLKKELDKNREKKEVVVVILGHAIKSVESPVPLESPVSKASHWSVREKIRHFEVNALDRVTLFDPFIHLSSRLSQPPAKSGFHQLSMRASKATKENS